MSLILVLAMAAGLLAFPALADGADNGDGQSSLSVASVTVLGKDLEGRAVKPDTTITVTFDRALKKNSDENDKMIYAEDLQSIVAFDGDRTYTVNLSRADGGRYTFVIKAGMKADDGSTKGTSETAFSPAKACTRAQIVTFLYRAV